MELLVRRHLTAAWPPNAATLRFLFFVYEECRTLGVWLENKSIFKDITKGKWSCH